MERQTDLSATQYVSENPLQKRDTSPRSLNAAVLAITASLDLDQVVAEIASRCAVWIDEAVTLVYVLNNSTDRLELIAGSSAARTGLARGQGTVGRAVASGRSILIPHSVTADDLPNHPVLERSPHSLVAVPLIYGGEAIGALVCVSMLKNAITQDEVDLLELIAPHAAAAIAHARLFERSREMLALMQGINDRSAAVNSVAQAILDAGHDLHRMLADALQRVLSLLSFKAGSILLATPTGAELHIVVHFRFPQDDAALAPIQTIHASDKGLAARAAQQRQPVVVQDVAHDPLTRSARDVLHRFGIGTIVAQPMIGDDTLVGVLLTAADQGSTIDSGVLDTLRVIANELAVGVNHARLFSRVRADQEQFKAVVTSSGDAVLSLDRQGRLTLANEAAQRVFNFESQAALGQPLAQATTNVALNTAVEQVVRNGTRERISFEVPLADDSTLFCNLSPIAEANGQVMGWVAVMQDITRFKETERMKSDMILTASHDLRNPVNLTLGALEMLSQAISEWTPIQREVYELAVLGVRRIEVLISDLLDLERIERRVGLNLCECDLIEIARTVITEHGLPTQKRQQTIEAHVPESLPPVRGDPQRLYQVMANLVSNAMKYTPNGGRITVGLHQEDDQILFEVTDTGYGIPKEAQARIFERFYRVAGSSTVDATGTGLGLALVKSIVDQHGGRVWVTSQVGQGSTFRVSLPVWRAPVRDDDSPSRLQEIKQDRQDGQDE